MNELLERYGTEILFLICSTIAVSVIAICFTIGQMNGNSHYYRALENCVSAGGTWIPMTSVGICLMNGATIHG